MSWQRALAIVALCGFACHAHAAAPDPRAAQNAVDQAAAALCAAPDDPIPPVVARLIAAAEAAGFAYSYAADDAANDRAIAAGVARTRADQGACRTALSRVLAQQMTPARHAGADAGIGAGQDGHLIERSLPTDGEGDLDELSMTPPAHHAARPPQPGSFAVPPLPPPAPPPVASSAPPPGAPPSAGQAAGLSDVDAALSKLISGNVAFNAPDKATVGTGTPIEVRLSVSETPSALAAELSGPGPRQTAGLQVADRMVATLDGGAAFDVSPAGPQSQFISHRQSTVWDWTVTPKQSGQQTLTLGFDAVLTVDGQQGTRRINTLRRNIDVVVAPPSGLGGWLKAIGDWMNTASWLWSAPILAAAGFIWHWLGKRRAKPPD